MSSIVIKVLIAFCVCLISSLYLTIILFIKKQTTIQDNKTFFFKIYTVHLISTIYATLLLPLFLFILRQEAIFEDFIDTKNSIVSTKLFVFIGLQIILTLNYEVIYTKIFSHFFPDLKDKALGFVNIQSIVNEALMSRENNHQTIEADQNTNLPNLILIIIETYNTKLFLGYSEVIRLVKRTKRSYTNSKIKSEINKLLNQNKITLKKRGMFQYFGECPIPCVNLIFFKFCLNNFIKKLRFYFYKILSVAYLVKI